MLTVADSKQQQQQQHVEAINYMTPQIVPGMGKDNHCRQLYRVHACCTEGHGSCVICTNLTKNNCATWLARKIHTGANRQRRGQQGKNDLKLKNDLQAPPPAPPVCSPLSVQQTICRTTGILLVLAATSAIDSPAGSHGTEGATTTQELRILPEARFLALVSSV